jgi:hypothetical protein
MGRWGTCGSILWFSGRGGGINFPQGMQILCFNPWFNGRGGFDV